MDDQGAASVGDVLFADLRSAIARGVQQGMPVDVCEGSHDFTGAYVLAAQESLTLRGQGTNVTTIRAIESTSGEQFRITQGEITLEELTVIGPGTDETDRLVEATPGRVTLNRVAVSDMASVLFVREANGESSWLNIRNSTFHHNAQIVEAIGGVDVTILNSVFVENDLPSLSRVVLGFGSEPSIFAGPIVTIRDSEFVDNAGDGNSVLGLSNAALQITDTVFRDNVEIRPLDVANSTVDAIDTVIEGTTISGTGGAVLAISSTITGLTIRDNRAGSGGGAYLIDSELVNTELVRNSASDKGGALFIGGAGLGVSVITSDCVVHNNDAPEGPAVFVNAVRFDSERADLGGASAGTDNGTGPVEVLAVDADGITVGAARVEDQYLRCYPDRACEVTE